MKRWLDLKLFLLMIGSTAFLIIFSNLGAYAYESVFVEADGYAAGTEVGTVSIEGLTAQEAMTTLLDAVDHWKKTSSFTFTVQDNEIELQPSFFNFDIKSSVDAAKDGQATPILAAVDIENLQNQLKEKNKELTELINFDLLTEDLKATVTTLEGRTYTFDLYEYLNVESEVHSSTLAQSTITGYHSNLEKYIVNWAEKLGTVTVDALESYSLLSNVEVEQLSNQSLEALNLISSGLYEAVLLAGMEVDERFISDSLNASSIRPGLEAIVIPGSMDLSFKNTNPMPIDIHFKLENSSLVTEIEGYPTEYKYELKFENQQSFSPKKVLQYTASLSGNQQRVVAEGEDGLQVEVYRQKYDKNNTLVESQLISKDFYPPVHTVIQVPLAGDATNDAETNRNSNEAKSQPTEQQEDSINNDEQNPDSPDNENQEEPDEDEIIWGSPDEIEKGE